MPLFLALALALVACGADPSETPGPSAQRPAADRITSATQPRGLPSRPDNLLSLANGAVLVSASTNANGALSLIDGSLDTRWGNGGPRYPMPHTFVFELRAPTRLTQVGADNSIARPSGVEGGSARTIDVEGSSEGPEAGFTPLGSLQLAPDETSLLEVAGGPAVRWLRFTVRENHGAAGWVYFDEVIAYGRQDPVPDDGRFAGVFEAGPGNTLTLHQNGPTLTGCYQESGGHSTGTLLGSVEAGVARLTWHDNGSSVNGTVLLVIDSRGHLAGVRFRDRSRRFWGGPPAAPGTVTPCSDRQGPSNPIADALEQAGEVTLYGIHFDFDEATLRPDSEPVLAQLLDALQQAPGAGVTIEGHTDDSGADAYNLDLSQRRAAAVVAWLVERGIETSQLTPVGRGESAPVADNATADGRALNRRVTVIRNG